MHVLIVEDELPVARVVAEALQAEGHEVNVAQDGPEALALLGPWLPDVVFLDVRLGEMDGVEVLRRIREAHGQLPVVLVTGHASAEVREAALRLGVEGIVEKPFFLQQLTNVLQSRFPRRR